jgi:aspartate kinase
LRTALKFGGTSVGDGEAMERTAAIIMAGEGERAVIVSAMSGVTNQLIAMMREPPADGYLDALRERHLAALRPRVPEREREAFAKELEARLEALGGLVGLYHGLEDNIMIQDAISSWGERLSSLALASLLEAKGQRSVALTSEEAGIVATGLPGNGSADLEATSENLRRNVLPLMRKGVVPIITGYYGVSEGRPLTFGRGGSDYSGAVLGHGLDADAIEIWTDVDGFMTADPRVVPGARVLEEMDYGEAAELAYFGAKVLHPRTIEPARQKGIAVRVKNTFNPSAKGTRIHGIKTPSRKLLRSVAMKSDLAIVKFYSSEIAYQPALITKLLDDVSSSGVTLYAVSTSLSTLALAVPVQCGREIGQGVRAGTDVEKVTVKEDVTLICAVGDSMLQNCGVSAKVFSAAASVGANIEMISEGASDVALNFVVPTEKAVELVRKLHDRYIGGSK